MAGAQDGDTDDDQGGSIRSVRVSVLKDSSSHPAATITRYQTCRPAGQRNDTRNPLLSATTGERERPSELDRMGSISWATPDPGGLQTPHLGLRAIKHWKQLLPCRPARLDRRSIGATGRHGSSAPHRDPPARSGCRLCRSRSIYCLTTPARIEFLSLCPEILRRRPAGITRASVGPSETSKPSAPAATC